MGVVLFFILIALVYRQLKGRQFLRVLLETTNQSTMILLITACSAVIATVLSFLSVPQDLAVTELELNRWLVMVVSNVVLLIMGLITPPVGLNLYVLKGIVPEVPITEIL